MEVEYCPAEEMWADVLTKHLQGRAFREMRSKLMNMPVDYAEDTKLKSSIRGKKRKPPISDRRGVLEKLPSTKVSFQLDRRRKGQTSHSQRNSGEDSRICKNMAGQT